MVLVYIGYVNSSKTTPLYCCVFTA